MEEQYKCITLLEGGAKDWGRHVLMPYGVTLCGQPTPEAVKMFPVLIDPLMLNLISGYKEEKWDITCEKCLEMVEIVKSAEKQKLRKA